jgi:hypothetical protein
MASHMILLNRITAKTHSFHMLCARFRRQDLFTTIVNQLYLCTKGSEQGIKETRSMALLP